MRNIIPIASLALATQAQITPPVRQPFRSSVYHPSIARSHLHTSPSGNYLQSLCSSKVCPPSKAGPTTPSTATPLAAASANLGTDTENDNVITIYKISSKACTESAVPKYSEALAGFFAGYKKGTCASRGFTEADATKIIGVPFLGQITLSTYKKVPASGAFITLLGETLRGAEGEESTTYALAGKSAVALLFSARWCGPCKMLLRSFAKAYKSALQAKGLEVVVVSLDKDEAEFENYYENIVGLNDVSWFAVPFARQDVKDALCKRYRVKGLPSLIILDADGDTITTDGKSKVELDPMGNYFPWKPENMRQTSPSAVTLLARGFSYCTLTLIPGTILALAGLLAGLGTGTVAVRPRDDNRGIFEAPLLVA